MSFVQKHRPAEDLLKKYGITSPNEIDLEAIAYCEGVKIKYKQLDGCEARLVGYRNRAVATITTDVSPRRQRFSLGHELGHWHYHRGRSFECRVNDDGEPLSSKKTEEKQADMYAADLLMPTYLFFPLASAIKRPCFDNIEALSDQFNSSLIATSIRYIDANTIPAILVCHGQQGRKWFKRSKDVPERWFPNDQLDADSFAMDVLYKGDIQRHPNKIGANSWFNRSEAYNYDILEHSRKIGEDVYTLLIIENDVMLEERSYSRGWR